ncbi:MAG: Gfo/Idh/MocA family oxidoreductase [Verrucomicrobiota bacterium]
MNRRHFISRTSVVTAAALAAPQVLPSRLLGQSSPSNQITLGFIGMGLQGSGRNLRGFQSVPVSRVVAVCDCDRSKLPNAKEIVDKQNGDKDCDVYQDFREILARDDIDAVVISTPDHWHVPMSLMALEAGKHVFCEKPSLTITEGQDLVEAVNRSDKVFQWGIEDRSLIKYWLLTGLARTGAIGEVTYVHCGLPRKPIHWKQEAPEPIPEDLDWNLWLGPAPAADFTQSVRHPQRWRQHYNYSGGSLADWGSHLCDSAQVGIGMDESGPVEISGTAETIPRDRYVTAANGYDLDFKYSNGATINVANGDIKLRFEGTEGWVQCTDWNGKLEASDRNLLRNKTLGEHPEYWPRPKLEWPNFLDKIKDPDSKLTYGVEAGHHLANMLHLGNIALEEGTTVNWDPDSETFTRNNFRMQDSKYYARESRDWTRGL